MKLNLGHYLNEDYDSKGRFISYWHQIHEVKALGPRAVLEIGVSNKFFSKYLRDRGLKIVTLDIEGDLFPDIVGNVLALPFCNQSFDIVTCFELLEHLPYTHFYNSLKELKRVAKSHVLLSLPDVTTVYRILIEMPRIRPIKLMVKHPFPRPFLHSYDGQHYWEIGKKNFSLEKIKKGIRLSGFKIIKTYRIFEYPYHRFFLLSSS